MSSLSESVATLYVVRNPEEGTFGTVTVQFTITDANGSLAEGDLRPAQGFVVLEDGVRFKVRESRFLLATNIDEKSCVIVLDQFSFSFQFKAVKHHSIVHFISLSFKY